MLRPKHYLKWWDTYPFQKDQKVCWKIGPFELKIEFCQHEWIIQYERGHDPLANVCEIHFPYLAPHLTTEVRDTYRFGFSTSGNEIMLQPRLADRPVVVRPISPVYILPHSHVTIFLSTALWIDISLKNPDMHLHRTPLYRPSDTWFGPLTGDGELCYASQTFGRMRLQDMDIRPHRALTAVHIENLNTEPLYLERIKLPVELLSLYAAEDNTLWTNSVHLVSLKNEGLASIKIDRDPPAHAHHPKLIFNSSARSDNIILKALGSIFQ